MRRYPWLCLLCCIPLSCSSNDDSQNTDGASSKPDGGMRDATKADGAADAGAQAIVYSVRPAPGTTATEESTSSPTWVAIPGLASQTVTANGKDKYLFILNVTESWVSVAGKPALFTLFDRDPSNVETMVVYGGYTAINTHRVPITLVGAKQLSTGKHTIEARWITDNEKPANTITIGKSPSWLVVLRADENDLQFASRSIGGQILTSATWTDLGIPSVEVKVSGDYLLLLNAMASGTQQNAFGSFEIILDDGTSTQLTGGLFSTAFIDQYLTVTVVGVKSLSSGQKIKARGLGPGGNAAIRLPELNTVLPDPVQLIALRAPKGIAFGTGKTWTTTATNVFQDITSLSPHPVQVASKGGNHLFILSAPEGWVSQAGYGGYVMIVDGAYLSSCLYSSGIAYQRIPVALIGVKDLPAGKSYSIKAQGICGTTGAQAALGGLYPHWLLGFTQ